MRVTIDDEHLAKLETFTYYINSPRNAINFLIDFVFENRDVKQRLKQYYRGRYTNSRNSKIRVRVRPLSKARKSIRVPDSIHEVLSRRVEELLERGIVIRKSELLRGIVIALVREDPNKRPEIGKVPHVKYRRTTIIRVDEITYKLLISLRDEILPEEPLGYFLYDILESLSADDIINLLGGLE